MSLLPEQQQALDELMTHVRAPTAHQPLPPAQEDAWKALLGFSRDDLQAVLKNLLAQKNDYQERMLEWVEQNPLDAAFQFISIAAWAFYQVEKGVNPKIKTYIDAFYYIATSASVGYADIFAVTQAGRSIASLVMIVGPALADRSLDRPKTVKLASANRKDETSNP